MLDIKYIALIGKKIIINFSFLLKTHLFLIVHHATFFIFCRYHVDGVSS